MKIKRLGLAAILAISGLAALSLSNTASAGACQTYIDKANKVFGNLIQKSCVGISNTATLDNNPFVYTNPDGGCDLGLSLPGLPSFGGLGGSLDSCAIVKMVTSSTVNKANATIRDAMNKSVDTINQTSQSTIGTNVVGGGNIDVGTMVQQRIQQAASASGQ